MPKAMPKPLRVDTLPALQMAQRALDNPALKHDAETILSLCVLNLRNQTTVVPPEAVPALHRLLQGQAE
jgi:hypothetical protein